MHEASVPDLAGVTQRGAVVVDPKTGAWPDERHDLQPGDKILCINDRNLSTWKWTPGPVVAGRVYCVRELFFDAGNGVYGYCVHGIHGCANTAGFEWGFQAWRFRRVHD